MDRGRGVSEPVASSAAPDDGAACDQLGPITVAALLLCHPALDAGSSSCPKRNNNSDSPPRIFLDTASKRGMTKGVTPHVMRGPGKGRKKNAFCKCFCRYSLDTASMCGMTKAGIPGSRIGVRNDQMTASLCDMSRARSPVRPMGESGKKNDGEGRMREKDEQWKPAFIGQGTGKPEEDSG